MKVDALVIGAGPAGLMAAGELAGPGRRVMLAEAKPSIGRKFLMAGKSGLNLTRDQRFDAFLQNYGMAAGRMRPMLEAFGPREVVAWAEGLGQPVFTGTTGRVFPNAMKSSPLLRAWATRLTEAGVEIRTRWRWSGWSGPASTFQTPNGPASVEPDVTVMALGGASWARLGSDGLWTEAFARTGIALAPFRPANVGLVLRWSEPMARHFGTPVKGAALIAGSARSRGEFVISQRGLEGGGIYAICAAVREGAPLEIDLMPDVDAATLARKLQRPRGKESLSNHLRKALRLDKARLALLMEFGRPLPQDPTQLAALIRHLPVTHEGPRPLDEAISTAGGVRWDAVTDDLSLTAHPNVFVAGEMLDWEAPTGGYLLTGCLATGQWAGRAAARRLA
jgi:uncharacterized flavoprotein (TIGR03862 family)